MTGRARSLHVRIQVAALVQHNPCGVHLRDLLHSLLEGYVGTRARNLAACMEAVPQVLLAKGRKNGAKGVSGSLLGVEVLRCVDWLERRHEQVKLEAQLGARLD